MAIITLSEGTFTGARRLAECLAEKLGYKLVNRDDVIGKLQEYGISGDTLDHARRRRLGMLQRIDTQWRHYLVCSRAVLSKEIRQGNLVYLGDGGRSLLRDFPNVLRVKIISDIEHRMDRLMKRVDYVIDRKRSQQLIEKMDERRGGWRKGLYSNGWHEPSEFDLVVELGVTSVSDAFEKIRSAAEKHPFQATQESLDAIELMKCAAELRALIATEADVKDDRIEVRAQDGVLIIDGSVRSTEEAEAIVELLDRKQVSQAIDLSQRSRNGSNA